MRIIYLCHYFHPEIGAPSARGLEMARQWVRSGHRVKVVTCFPNHPTGVVQKEYRWVMFRKETLEGIEVFRNFVYATPNRGVVRKTFGHLSFMLSSLVFSLRRTGDADVLVVSSPTLLSVISAFVFSRVKKIPYVFEVRDLWPAIFVDLGVISNQRLIRWLEAIEMFLYRKSKKIVVVTDSFRRTLIERGIDASKIAVITNGADIELFSPDREGGSVRHRLGLVGKFVVLYVGAHGISQGLQCLIDVATGLESDEIHFLFVGEGAERESLIATAEGRGLRNVTFLAGQPKEQIPLFYAASDVCLVPLRGIPLFRGFIPSKMFEVMASGRPIIASVDGESRAILALSKAALITPPEDVPAIRQAILRLSADPELCGRLGSAGRRFVVENYSRRQLADRYETVLRRVVQDEARDSGCLAI